MSKKIRSFFRYYNFQEIPFKPIEINKSQFPTMIMWILTSVTRLGNLLDFGQLFEAFDNNEFVQTSHILRHFL